MSSYLGIVAVFVVGIAAGFLNVTAGGGSLLSLPMLVFTGLPLPVANATNRISIFFQNTVATTKFYRSGALSVREALSLTVPATLGSVVGTSLAIELNPKVLQISISILISVMAFFLLFKPSMWEKERRRDVPRPVLFLIFFGIGVYGGFVQAGVGFIFLWALSGVVGHDLLRSNALKVAVILSYTSISVAMFAAKGLLDLKVGLVLACGSMLGGYLGARFAVSKGSCWIRWMVVGAVIVSAFKMMFQALSA
ncbi:MULTISPECIES: sulfite exporter TauE/SafE family protein [Dethiosulfovibrio]|uniref:Probable membrane transporter protein n=2 Tax=Dethiosulfovibrio TaxID=47054 RepID=A0ABS9EJN9_9BACT|nr:MULTISPECIES: sulfite exporter TauE/SafE family protein [Dethiosulfovibrio]MCF4112911.1 sulfite exporter TauE/SafE family protein [Dethiosulfovibrio russensis]MCF4141375.1 sulfite exporter TauE/SafE family protein [Dethiosulfovibrio marinus]MCF4144330.1 sulfite exporter TauE/SafE family protein [Dethiosulfovibrio acidaminovorans]